MLTAYQIITSCCQQQSKELSTTDFDKLVQVISRAYRHRYIKKTDAPTGVPIAGSGFLIEERKGIKMVVVYYPNTPLFLSICNSAIEDFFIAKAARIKLDQEQREAAQLAKKQRQEERQKQRAKKKRKRIPLRPELRPDYQQSSTKQRADI